MRTIKVEVEVEIWESDEHWPMLLAQNVGKGTLGEERFNVGISGSTFVLGLSGESRRHVYVKCANAIHHAIKEATKP